MADTQASASPRQTTNASTALNAFEQRLMLMDKALSKQRAVPFGDSNEIVDNNHTTTNNNDDNPTTMSENNDIPVDEEAGSNVNSSEQNTMRPEIIDDDYDDAPLPPSQISALYI